MRKTQDMKKIAFILSLAAAIALPLFSFAHPGHGETDGFSIIHYFVEPQHAVITIGVFALSFVYFRYARKNNRRAK
jgi:predicted permease